LSRDVDLSRRAALFAALALAICSRNAAEVFRADGDGAVASSTKFEIGLAMGDIEPSQPELGAPDDNALPSSAGIWNRCTDCFLTRLVTEGLAFSGLEKFGDAVEGLGLGDGRTSDVVCDTLPRAIDPLVGLAGLRVGVPSIVAKGLL
jgi:hypothetical protein